MVLGGFGSCVASGCMGARIIIVSHYMDAIHMFSSILLNIIVKR